MNPSPLFLLSFLGGVLTILSPCILPVLPFVLTKADEPFRRSGLPLLIGMAITFAIVATLAAVGGGWVVRANQYGRWIALAFVVLFGLALFWPAFAHRMTRPFVVLGKRLAATGDSAGHPRSSVFLGVATGLLWAPCAGPILGLILTGAAISGPNIETSLLLLTYAAGAAVSLSAALLMGGKVFAAMKRSLRAERWIRRGLGGAVVAGALAIAFGLDTGLLARVSTASTTRLEEALFGHLMTDANPIAAGTDTAMPDNSMMMSGTSAMTGGAMTSARNAAVPAETQRTMPSLDGATAWLNSEPLTNEALHGNVVLVDFWTHSCINCIRALPYVKAWHERYGDKGLVVIGVHSPEFAFEKDLRNVRREVADLGIEYPVAIDNDYALWRAFSNRYWPAHYFIDAQGRIRHTHFGEGGYADSERVIQRLLEEAGRAGVAGAPVTATGEGAALPSDRLGVLSPETYVAYARAENFASEGGLQPEKGHTYTAPSRLRLNEWALDGTWTVGEERAVLTSPHGRIVFRFQARDLHLVLGPAADGEPIVFRVRLDSAPPGADHGVDVGDDGIGTIDRHRLYQLIRQSGKVRDRTFEIEFQDPGIAVYAFTFG